MSHNTPLDVNNPNYHSQTLVEMLATKPTRLKLISLAEQRASPPMTGSSARQAKSPVTSPVSTREITTVKAGADDLTVSVKLTET